MKILIVEDDHEIRLSLEEILMDMGHEVATTIHGLDALRYLHKTEVPPAVILLDLMMPVMDGREFLSIRQRDPELYKIPVIAMTAASIRYLPLEDLRGYFRKPVDLAHLVRMLSAIQEGNDEDPPKL